MCISTRPMLVPISMIILLLWLTGCAGPAQKTSGYTDPEWLTAARQQNARQEALSAQGPAEKQAGPTAPPAIEGMLTLDKAIAYALDHNLDVAVSRLETDIQKEAVAGARLKMLPSLMLDGEIGQRDEYDASYSEPLFEQGAQDYNYSRDKETQRFHAELNWDLLNFGIAYYQQRQAGDQYRISEQQRRRVIQNLRFEVAKTYWELLTTKKSMEMARGLVRRLAEREQVLRKQLRSRTTSELDALAATVALSEMRLNMSGFEHEYRRCSGKLASLMGLPPGMTFEIPDDGNAPLPEIQTVDIGALETEALLHRPELYEQDLEERIAQEDARIAIARSLPRPSLFYRYSHDNDSHLYYNEWSEVGVRLTMDLLSVPQHMSGKHEAVLKKSKVRTRRLSMAAAIVTQLRLAVIDFEDAQRKYRHLTEIADKRRSLLEARRRHADLGNSTYEEVIESEADSLFANVRSLSARMEVLIAEQRILNSMGSEDIGKRRLFAQKGPDTKGR